MTRSDAAASALAVPAEPFHVVSGCSGSGKSTLVAALAARGEAVVREPGREIVRQQLAEGGDGLPWANRQRFVDLCAERALRDFDAQRRLGRRCFFDRSLVDVASAVELEGLAPPEGLAQALRSRRYAPRVFISPPWEALFRGDAERRHDFSAALAEYAVLVPCYRRCGYQIVEVPRGSPDERVAFVLATLAARAPGAAGRPLHSAAEDCRGTPGDDDVSRDDEPVPGGSESG